MTKITLFAALLISVFSFSQIALTSFEEPDIFSGKYTDTMDPNFAHDLLNNPGEPLVNFTKMGVEMGFKASYVPYDTPGAGSTDSDFIGVTKTKPSSTVLFTDGSNGYRMNDTDGNYILEFDPVSLMGVIEPTVTLDFLLSINSDATKGNYEGDGTINQSGHDRLRIYIRDITNNTEKDLFNSTGSDLDDFVPFDSATGEYQLQWQSMVESLMPETVVQLVIDGRNNSGSESFWFDNIVFDHLIGLKDQNKFDFSIYPNPATKGYINITSKTTSPKYISIFDVLGKQVLKTVLNGQRLDISSLNSGVYIIKIEQGKSATTKKLVVQ